MTLSALLDGTDRTQGTDSPLTGMDVFDDWDDYP